MRRFSTWLASRLLLLLGATLRTRRLGWSRVTRLRARQEPYVFAVLHGRALLMLPELRREGCTALVSESRDGDLASGFLRSLGYGVVRGSSSRGGVGGLRALCRSQATGRVPAITVDGPRGPAGQVAPGVVGLSRITGSWIVPIAASCSSATRLDSWDHTLIPRPGSRNLLLFGQPLRAQPGQPVEEVCAALQSRLAKLHQQADRLTGVAR